MNLKRERVSRSPFVDDVCLVVSRLTAVFLVVVVGSILPAFPISVAVAVLIVGFRVVVIRAHILAHTHAHVLAHCASFVVTFNYPHCRKVLGISYALPVLRLPEVL